MRRHMKLFTDADIISTWKNITHNSRGKGRRTVNLFQSLELQQTMFQRAKTESDAASKASYIVSLEIAKTSRCFSEGKTVTKTVHLIRARGLNHCQLQASLEEFSGRSKCSKETFSISRFAKPSLTNVIIPSAGFAGKLNLLYKAFERRFSDFNKQQFSFQLFSNQFGVDVNNAPVDIQMVLIELQCNDTLLLVLQSFSPYYQSRYHRSACTLQGLSMCGSTYVCEQLFSLMKLNKSSQTSQLNDCIYTPY
ncbi:GTD2A protein, partial [Amia calva]|nr:GTD2A protein [Amia calva]